MKKPSILGRLPGMLRIIRRESREWKEPVVGLFTEGQNAPFKVLISTVLSLRTKDETTEAASNRLFQLADDPRAMLKLDPLLIEKAIYPVGFYRTKSKNILKICGLLIAKFGGNVPDDIETLLTLPGVGRKTANLTVALGYNKPGICVDTHVHRICNRWGLVRTKTPEETEEALRRLLPKRYWMEFNELLVSYGQNICRPVSPKCGICKLSGVCPKLGVTHRR